MMRQCTFWIVAVSLFVAPTGLVSAQDKDEVSKLKAIEIQLEQMSKGLEKDFKTVADHIKSLKDEMTAANKDALLKLQDAQNRIGALERQLLQLRGDLDALQKRGSTSLYPPNGKERTSFYPAPAGALLVENRYAEPILLVVGGASYRIEPNQSRQVEGIPAGTINYSIISSWGEQRRSSTIMANTPLRVNVQ
jgi:hypothetical protein